MKKLLFGLLVAIAATACTNDEPEAPKVFHLDPNAKVRISANVSTMQKVRSIDSTATDTISREVALDIVKRATNLAFYNDSLFGGGVCIGGFAGKDTVSKSPAFLRWGTDILSIDGFGKTIIVPDFIYMRDCAITIMLNSSDVYHMDTIAYIPNKVLRDAEKSIKSALQNKDTTSVYSIFQNAFKFKPCTGAEYRKLKAEGKN